MSLGRAYLELLMLPHDAQRIRLQPVLARFRDEIAAETGKEAEEIQNSYEAMAARLKEITG